MSEEVIFIKNKFQMGSENLTFLSGFGESKEARQLIAGLLSPSPSRLNFRQIKKHAFFVRTPWETLRESKYNF
jgi:hypothetical protein